MTGDLDAGGHEALTQAILARTSGSACATARERLCDFVDGALEAFDGGLVGGHLAHCPGCSALAAALAEAAEVLPSFAGLAPRRSVVGGVLAATSRRPARPSFGDRAAAWLGRAAARPRFSLEVAYVMTVLLLVVLGNPVAAFRGASARVEPRVAAVAGAVSGPIARVRAAGEERLGSIGRAIAPKTEAAGALEQGRAYLLQVWQKYVDAPARAIFLQVRNWAERAVGELRAIFGAGAREPRAGAAR